MRTQRTLVSIFSGACLTGLVAGAAIGEPARPPVLLAQEATPQAQPKAKAAAPQASQDSALKERIEQLEEQLVDMQVVVGTLELLARGGGSAAPAAGAAAMAAAVLTAFGSMASKRRCVRSPRRSSN